MSSSKKKPRRTFIAAVIGIPDAGKSSLIRRLLPLLEDAGIVAVSIGQDRPDDLITDFFKTSVGESARDIGMPSIHRDTRSLVYRAIARIAHDKARRSAADVVLLEHDPNFTWIMERHLAEVSARRLSSDFEKMTEPELVLYLPTNPEEVKARRQELGKPLSKVLKEGRRLERIHHAMLAAAADKNWCQIISPQGETLPEEEAASLAFRAFMLTYQHHLNHPQPIKKFWMRGMRKKRPPVPRKRTQSSTAG